MHPHDDNDRTLHDIPPTQATEDIQADLLPIRAHMKQSADSLRAFLHTDGPARQGALTALCGDLFRRRESVSLLCLRNERMFVLAGSALEALARAVVHLPDDDAGARAVRSECGGLVRGLRASRQLMRASERELPQPCECVFDAAFRFDPGSPAAQAAAERVRDILR